jgi:hypothetical protein
LAAASPEHRPAYAEAGATIGIGLGAIGRIAEALAAFRAGLDVRRTLAAIDARQYDNLLGDLASATLAMSPHPERSKTEDAADTNGGGDAGGEFVGEALRIWREHPDVLTSSTRRSAAAQLRQAGFSAEADELSGERG